MNTRAVLVLLLGCLCLTGCRSHRSLLIESNPPGASVRLDHELVGTTPVRVPFDHYGVRRVSLQLEGHRSVSERVSLRGPWYSRFPLDLFSEVFLPLGLDDDHAVMFELEAGIERPAAPELRQVLARGEALRRAGPEGPRVLPPLELAPRAEEETEDAPASADAVDNSSADSP